MKQLSRRGEWLIISAICALVMSPFVALFAFVVLTRDVRVVEFEGRTTNVSVTSIDQRYPGFVYWTEDDKAISVFLRDRQFVARDEGYMALRMLFFREDRQERPANFAEQDLWSQIRN